MLYKVICTSLPCNLITINIQYPSEKRNEYVQPDSDGLHEVLGAGNELFKKGTYG
jgi:hypothetical protein